MDKSFLFKCILSASLFAFGVHPVCSENRRSNSGDATPTVYYYDAQWRGVQSEDFATYVRYIYYSSDSHFPNRFVDYYKVDKSVEGDGTFVSIDKYDDSKSVFIESKTYYPNGNVKRFVKNADGSQEVVDYYENGNKSKEYVLCNGRMEGIVKDYGVEGWGWTEKYYRNGEIDMSKQTYAAKTTDGDAVYHDLLTNKKISLETPSLADMQQEYNNGQIIYAIKKNGIQVGVCADKAKDYNGGTSNAAAFFTGLTGINFLGSNSKEYMRLMVVIRNGSATPIVFDPANCVIKDISKKKPKDVKLVSFSEYTKKMDEAQSEALANKAYEENRKAKEVATTSSSFSSASAYSQSDANGYSNSNTSASLNGQSSSGAVYGAAGAAYGNGYGAAVVAGGASASSSNINGRYNSSSSSGYNSQASGGFSSASGGETRDANVYRQGLLDAEAKIDSYSNALQEENLKKRSLYMKPVQIAPFETYVGFVYSKQTKITKISYDVVLEGITYPFEVTVSDYHN